MSQERGLTAAVRKILEEVSLDVLEERVIAYIVRELHNGRSINVILNDTYVRNRTNEERLNEILESPDVLAAVDEELNRAFSQWDFKFEEG